MRILYRVRQFWRTVSLKKAHPALDDALAVLSPTQGALFSRMPRAEQEHALTVLRRLWQQGETQPDLLVAALMHDVGKLCCPIGPFYRAIVVIGKAVVPGQSRRWGELPPAGWEDLPMWHKAFIAADHHAEWGAQLASQAGVSSLAERLIRLHHQSHGQGADPEEIQLHHKLHLVDNES